MDVVNFIGVVVGIAGVVVGIAGFVVGIAGVVVGISQHYETKKYQEQAEKYRNRLRTVTWDELRMHSQDLRKKIEFRQPEIPETGQPKIPPFQPDIIFTPCRRGATVANLMYGVDQNILLYVGIRVDNYRGTPKINHLQAHGWAVAQTAKYDHWIPDILLKDPYKSKNLLILDDFAMSGDSIDKIKSFFIENNFEGKIVTATIICTTIAKSANKAPDHYSHLTEYDDFSFPWGKAV